MADDNEIIGERALTGDLVNSLAPAAITISASSDIITAITTNTAPENQFAASQALAAAWTELAPLARLVDAPVPVYGARDPNQYDGLPVVINELVSRSLRMFAADTLHMDCELRLATAVQARDALHHELASAREERAALVREHEREVEELRQHCATAQSTLDSLRARMLVDAQDLATVEEQLQAAVAREAAQQHLIQQLRGQLSVKLFRNRLQG